MPSNVTPLPRHSRAKRHQAEQIRQLVDDLGLSPEAAAEIDNTLYKITEVPGRKWTFTMINQDQFQFVTKAILAGDDAGKTLAVWNIALTYIRMDTGEIMASRGQLAKDTGTLPCHVSTAMTRLTQIGAIMRRSRGRKVAYFVNPNVGWNGGEGTRQEAAKGAPALRLVVDRDVPAPPAAG